MRKSHHKLSSAIASYRLGLPLSPSCRRWRSGRRRATRKHFATDATEWYKYECSGQMSQSALSAMATSSSSSMIRTQVEMIGGALSQMHQVLRSLSPHLTLAMTPLMLSPASCSSTPMRWCTRHRESNRSTISNQCILRIRTPPTLTPPKLMLSMHTSMPNHMDRGRDSTAPIGALLAALAHILASPVFCNSCSHNISPPACKTHWVSSKVGCP